MQRPPRSDQASSIEGWLTGIGNNSSDGPVARRSPSVTMCHKYW
jgi:hypothetical protein